MQATPSPSTPSTTVSAWRGPRWALAMLVAALGSLGPFAIDAYLPAFEGMARDLGATPVQMQQTLSVYLFGFALMNLFHGALSDSVGRRPVILVGTSLFSLASVGCAMAPSIGWLLVCRVLQGVSAGAGMVVARALVRDLYTPVEAQRVMSQVTLFFGIAPAVAPMFGGLLYAQFGWASIFWFLAVSTALVAIVNARWLPETLRAEQRQPLSVGSLLRGYATLLRHRSFVRLVLVSSVPFNGFFLYVLSAPAFLGELLHVPPTQFFLFFLVTIGGVMLGAAVSGRLAGRLEPRRQVMRGFRIMALAMVINITVSLVLPPHPLWSTLPLGLYSFGWSLMTPAVTLMALDLVPQRRGMASSLQSCIGSLANAVCAGVVAPLVMHSAVGLALASAGVMTVGLVAWLGVRGRLHPGGAGDEGLKPGEQP